MANQDDVYREFGRVSELIQLLETELGTLLLCNEAIENKAYIFSDKDASARLLSAIEKKTLGATIKAVSRRFDFRPEDDLSRLFDDALVARNRLVHHFFREHGVASATSKDDDYDEMIRDIESTRPVLEEAYMVALAMGGLLFDALMLLKKVHQ